MALSAKTVRAQLALITPLMQKCSLETCRKGQDRLGEMMEAVHRRQVMVKVHPFRNFNGCWIIPRDERRQGVILYLHGGGYTCGGLDYSKGFGSTLAADSGTRVFSAAYRLAPECPFPAALDDALTAYQYLLKKGYDSRKITLCGESAGGGLCYCLCLRLRQEQLPMPGGIIAISPWTDLTASGPSYEQNKEADPSMSAHLLSYYADCYTKDRKNPMVSPLFGDLEGMPPSLIFVGGDEIMLSDAQLLHKKLLENRCRSHLTVAPGLWHGYLLYPLKENEKDYVAINQFLNKYMSEENKLRWVKLDNAAKIYPAARRRNWSNVFRLSATLKEPVDVPVLQSALDVTVRRFPSIAARLRKGLFWYYLQQLPAAPSVSPEYSYPLARMDTKETRKCAFRAIAYENRIAVEFFHSLTDGNGALVFLKTLVAEYLQQKYGIAIPAEKGVLGRLEDPSQEELEDSFQKYAGPVTANRSGSSAFRLQGTREPEDFLHLTCLQMSVPQVLKAAHEYDISLTGFLCAAMMEALTRIQREKVANPRKQKPIKVLIPVNLRKLFPSTTLRNFAMYTIPEIDPKLGEYSFQEICQVIKCKMGADITPKQMSKMIAANVSSERLLAIRLMPLPIKNMVMKAVFNAVGERTSCIGLSNLGAVSLPECMQEYVERMDFILGVQATAPHNCGVLSYKDTLYINFIRNTKESELEYQFYRVLRDMGLSVTAESNTPWY